MDHPLLFSTPMVRAMMLRWKRVTRRPVKTQPRRVNRLEAYVGDEGLWRWQGFTWELQEDMLASLPDFARWKPGDRIWTRETWRGRGGSPRDTHYRADPDEPEAPGCWRPSIFLRKSAARFFLPVLSVRAELLRGLTEDEALAEGIPKSGHHAADLGLLPRRELPVEWERRTPAENYLRLWDKINPTFPAAANPVVWRIEFEVPNEAPRWGSACAGMPPHVGERPF